MAFYNYQNSWNFSDKIISSKWKVYCRCKKLIFLGHPNYRALHACVEKRTDTRALEVHLGEKSVFALHLLLWLFLRIIFPFAHPVWWQKSKRERGTNAKVARYFDRGVVPLCYLWKLEKLECVNKNNNEVTWVTMTSSWRRKMPKRNSRRLIRNVLL